MIKKSIIASCILAGSLNITNADMIGLEGGYALWNSSLKGDISSAGESVDFENDLGYGDKLNNGFFWVDIEHPLPIIPNIKLQKTNFEDSSVGTITKNFTFAGESFTTSSEVTSSLEMYQNEIIPYWDILDNWVHLDVGLNIKQITGNIKMDATGVSVDKDFDVILPTIYAKTRFDLPFTGLSAEGDISAVKYQENEFIDYKIGLRYETEWGLGANAGYRSQSITLDDIDDITGTIKMDGFFVGMFYHF